MTRPDTAGPFAAAAAATALWLFTLLCAGAAEPQPTTEKTAFLGVTTSPAEAALRAQLGLPRGMGLIVDAVEPGSPAEKAGLRKHDVLYMLDDQLLVTPEQFGILLRSMEPGRTVSLVLFRSGRQQTVKAALGQRERPAREYRVPVPIPEELLQRMLPEDGTLLPAPDNGAVSVITSRRAFEMSWSDPQHTLRLRGGTGDSMRLVVEDAEGNRIFEGAVDTAEQRAALAASIREKLEEMERSLRMYLPADRLPPATRPSRQGGR